jgi:hypothetical protein
MLRDSCHVLDLSIAPILLIQAMKEAKTTIHREKKTLKQRLLQGLSEDIVNIIYLTVFFGVFTAARRLTLAHYGIEVDDYFIALIKALVIAKVIKFGAFLKFSGRYENEPLIVSVLFKVALFILLVVLFDATEALIKGIINTQSLTVAFDDLVHHHFSKFWLGGLLMVALSLIPFFMLKEMSRVMGNAKFRDMLLKKR